MFVFQYGFKKETKETLAEPAERLFVLKGVKIVPVAVAREAQEKAEKVAWDVFSRIAKTFYPSFKKLSDDTKKTELGQTIDKLSKPLKINPFKGCEIQYAYGKDTDIYSVRVKFPYEPVRILTVKIGKDSTELSLADEKGNPLQVLEQKGSHIVFNDYTRVK